MTNTGPEEIQQRLFDTHFSTLKDPRRTNKGNIKFSLQEIIFLTLSAVISGFQTYELICGFGKHKLEWLRKFYPYEKGIPSHDVLGDFFSRLEPKSFSKCMVQFTQSLSQLDSEVVALDGKTVKGFIDKDGFPLHIITAFCTKNRMSLGEEIVAGKENEITAIPRLLELISIKNTIITIDAIGCQTAIAEKIREQEADYILQVKANQKSLLENIEDSFEVKKIENFHQQDDCGHGRVEMRKCSVIKDLEFLEEKEQWKDLCTIIRIESEIYHKKTQEITQNTRYYISSLQYDSEQFNQYIRTHWMIENNLHWNLDVIFKEDNQAKRNAKAIENVNIISKFAIKLLDDEKTYPKSKPLKRQKAFADDTYRELIMNL